MDTKIINWNDIDCVARVIMDREGKSISFEIFQIAGRSVNTGENYFYAKNARSSDNTTTDIDEAQTLIRGWIKWDACSHINFGDKDGYIHLCGGIAWYNFQEAIKRIWGIAIRELPEEHSKDMFDLELFGKQKGRGK
jgi:hypothetical protein